MHGRPSAKITTPDLTQDVVSSVLASHACNFTHILFEEAALQNSEESAFGPHAAEGRSRIAQA